MRTPHYHPHNAPMTPSENNHFMSIPLYQQHNAPMTPPENSHLGLWYTRFFNRYHAQWKLEKEDKEKWVSSVAHRKCGDDKVLTQQTLRLLTLVQALKRQDTLKEGDFAICETNWHFATGLGLPHPVENGLAWHHTLGVPYLAGNAVKGLLRAWVEIWDDSLSDKQRLQRRQSWFGMVKGEEGDERDQAGQLLFFDAIPIEPVRLIADIMTPHYGKWYEQGHEIQGPNMTDLLKEHHERLPADWHEPIPVPFLAVKQAKLLFVIVARDVKDKLLADEALKALKSLVEALKWIGVGAKTAAGYGHLVRKEATEKKLLETLNKTTTSPTPIQPDYLTLLKELEAGKWPDKSEQRKIASSIREQMQKHKKWKAQTKAKNPAKDKDYQRTQKVLKYLN